MKSNKLSLIRLIFFICITILSCKKEDLPPPSITISNFQQYQTYYLGDTIKIVYSINNSNLDSICLFINDSLCQTQIKPQLKFNLITNKIGQYPLKVIVYYNSGNTNSSKPLYVQVTNLNLRLVCTRNNGDRDYFVNDQLKIFVKHEIEWLNLNNMKQITLFLNDKSLGTKYVQPFSFETPIISNDKNTVKIIVVDTTNHIHSVEMPLIIPFNSPPVIDFGFGHYNDKICYFYSVDPIIYNISGSDNILTHYVNFYLDSKHIATDTINDNSYNYREFKLGNLLSGKHTGYCVAYDDRGDSTISNILNFTIYKTLDIADKIIELENTNDKNLVFGISKSKLYKINPILEEIVQTYDLPFQDATSIEYVNEEQKLYIGFSDGHLIYLDVLTNEFITVLSSEISNIDELKIDYAIKTAVLISNTKLLLLNLNSKVILNGSIDVFKGSSLIMDKVNKTIIAGGIPGSSNSNLYRLSYNATSLNLLDQKNLSLYIEKLLLKPGNTEFTIMEYSGIYCLGYRSFDFNGFLEKGKYSSNQPQTACYSTDGKSFYIGNDLDKNINVFDADNYSIIKSLYIPLTSYYQAEHMITNTDDSKLIVTTKHIFKDEVKIIFIRL